MVSILVDFKLDGLVSSSAHSCQQWAGPNFHSLLRAHHLIGAYFLTTESDKHMRLLTKLYGIALIGLVAMMPQYKSSKLIITGNHNASLLTHNQQTDTHVDKTTAVITPLGIYTLTVCE